MRKIAHTGAWVKRTVEGEQSACQGEKAWRINTGVENFCGWKGEGTQRGGGQGPGAGGRNAAGLGNGGTNPICGAAWKAREEMRNEAIRERRSMGQRGCIT